MSDAAPSKHLFLFHAVDCTDPDAVERREAVREKHLSGVAKLVDEGILKVVGGLLTPESITGGERKFTGCTAIAESTDIESMRKLVEADIYYTSNVWDRETILITPFLAVKI